MFKQVRKNEFYLKLTTYIFLKTKQKPETSP